MALAALAALGLHRHKGDLLMTLSVLLSSLMFLHLCASYVLLLYGLNYYVLLFLHRRAYRRMAQHDTLVQQTWQAGLARHPPASPSSSRYITSAMSSNVWSRR